MPELSFPLGVPKRKNVWSTAGGWGRGTGWVCRLLVEALGGDEIRADYGRGMLTRWGKLGWARWLHMGGGGRWLGKWE